MVSLRTFLPSLFVFKVSALLRGKLSHGLYLNRRFCLNLRSCNVKNKIDIWIKCFCLYLETQKLFSPDLVWHREIDIIATLFILLLFLNWKKKKKLFTYISEEKGDILQNQPWVGRQKALFIEEVHLHIFPFLSQFNLELEYLLFFCFRLCLLWNSCLRTARNFVKIIQSKS